ncbi:hypothetical protein GGX14DRAFT_134085 [Mycena pura]|uniref:DUF6533 domain-containing protein n=1 Tax=Mycena pura TaxID=153505 RepID=A0AAD6V9K6_9AGAR|nr:hypothetical protein GGX14DRAFT_134085 [Mycena pura]
MSSLPDLSSANDFQFDAYVDVACLTLLTYDTVLTFGREEKHIWKSKWSFIKLLYLWTRYGTFFDTAIAVQKRVGNMGPSYCRIATDFDTTFAGFGIGITEIILMIRTYAQYNRSKKLLGFFLFLWLSISGVSIWAGFQLAKSYSIQTSAPSSTSCDGSTNSNLGIVCFAALLVGETAIVSLTLWKGLRIFFLSKSRHRQSQLVTAFYRDGIMFYLIMLLIFIAAVVLQFLAPTPLQHVGDTPLRVIHSISACHLVIHVREIAHDDEDDINGRTILSGIAFASPPQSRRDTHTFIRDQTI